MMISMVYDGEKQAIKMLIYDVLEIARGIRMAIALKSHQAAFFIKQACARSYPITSYLFNKK